MNDWIELNLPFGHVFGRGLQALDSFSGRGLNMPGVLVRMQDGAEYLIGHLNEVGGVCDDCRQFPPDAVVSAYCVVWTADNMEVST